MEWEAGAAGDREGVLTTTAGRKRARTSYPRDGLAKSKAEAVTLAQVLVLVVVLAAADLRPILLHSSAPSSVCSSLHPPRQHLSLLPRTIPPLHFLSLILSFLRFPSLCVGFLPTFLVSGCFFFRQFVMYLFLSSLHPCSIFQVLFIWAFPRVVLFFDGFQSRLCCIWIS